MRGRNPASGNRGAPREAAGVRRRAIDPPRGVALITTVIILLMLGSLGAALVGLLQARLLSVTLEVDRLQAAYLAEAGLARALYEMTRDRDAFGNDGVGVIPPTAFGPGYFRVDKEPKSRSLIGVGVVRDVQRVIVNKY